MVNIFLTELQQNDVLLGRGTGPNKCEGNRRFRILSSQLIKKSYKKESADEEDNDESNMNNNHNKRMLAEKLVKIVHSRKGRFVRKLSKEESSRVAQTLLKTTSKRLLKKHKLPDLYVVVPMNVAIEKAKQSFRHQLRRTTRTTRGTKSNDDNEDNEEDVASLLLDDDEVEEGDEEVEDVDDHLLMMETTEEEEEAAAEAASTSPVSSSVVTIATTTTTTTAPVPVPPNVASIPSLEAAASAAATQPTLPATTLRRVVTDLDPAGLMGVASSPVPVVPALPSSTGINGPATKAVQEFIALQQLLAAQQQQQQQRQQDHRVTAVLQQQLVLAKAAKAKQEQQEQQQLKKATVAAAITAQLIEAKQHLESASLAQLQAQVHRRNSSLQQQVQQVQVQQVHQTAVAVSSPTTTTSLKEELSMLIQLENKLRTKRLQMTQGGSLPLLPTTTMMMSKRSTSKTTAPGAPPSPIMMMPSRSNSLIGQGATSLRRIVTPTTNTSSGKKVIIKKEAPPLPSAPPVVLNPLQPPPSLYGLKRSNHFLNPHPIKTMKKLNPIDNSKLLIHKSRPIDPTMFTLLQKKEKEASSSSSKHMSAVDTLSTLYLK